MSYGARIRNQTNDVILDATSRVPILVKVQALPYMAYTLANPFEPSVAPVPVSGCTPATHFAVVANGGFIPIVQNGQVDYVSTNKAGMFELVDLNDTLMVYRYQL